jgi:glycosyltransferase involved in cell wall biosynthesis
VLQYVLLTGFNEALVTKVYFDITDIVLYAKRNSTVVGIPRVELNIVSLLAKKYGGEVIRCVFFNPESQTLYEFDPSLRQSGAEFDAECLLIDLGLAKATRVLPSEVQVKSYLKRFSHNKPLRTLKKMEVYLSAVLMPWRLKGMGISMRAVELAKRKAIPISTLTALPPDSSYVCLGAVWFLPEVWSFARAHKARGGRVVQLVYDLIPISHPHYYTPKEPPAFTEWLNNALDYATHIACISRWTEVDLKKYAAARNRNPVTKVVPLAHEFAGFDRATKLAAPAQLARLVGTRYVLCVGTIEYRKNDIALLQIWQQLIAELGSKPPLLVFAGKYGKGGAEFQEFLANSPELRAAVQVVHAPSDQDLAWLYQNCLFTTYPSVFEGWGLPVGEAAWFGKYCVASNATSIPEVCGDLLEYVDPANIDSIKSGIVKAINDEGFLRRCEARIENAKLKAWVDVAEEVYAFATYGKESVKNEY